MNRFVAVRPILEIARKSADHPSRGHCYMTGRMGALVQEVEYQESQNGYLGYELC